MGSEVSDTDHKNLRSPMFKSNFMGKRGTHLPKCQSNLNCTSERGDSRVSSKSRNYNITMRFKASTESIGRLPNDCSRNLSSRLRSPNLGGGVRSGVSVYEPETRDGYSGGSVGDFGFRVKNFKSK